MEPILEAAWEIFISGLRMVYMFIIGAQDDDVDLSHKDRVPRFWANSGSDEQFLADLIMLGVGVCFGVIHCIAWHFTFPTHTELSMWQISSIAITAVPIYIPSSGKWHFFLGGLSYLFALKEFLRQISKIRHLTCLEIFEL